MCAQLLVAPHNAVELDKEASASWGLSPFALVEAAGRSCATVLEKELKADKRYAECLDGPVLVCAGSGNNGADALVMLRSLLVSKQLRHNASNNASMDNSSWDNSSCRAVVLLSRYIKADENTPRVCAVKALQAMAVPVITWNSEEKNDKKIEELFRDARLIIDGLSGTGIEGALEGVPLEMLTTINKRRESGDACQCRVISIDVPSGAGSCWKQDWPVVHADLTLAIEPIKTVLYTPAVRSHCGKIIPVNGIFPPQLCKKYGDAELHSWEECRTAVPSVPPDAYKYTRGVVEIHAGSPGTLGAARIAAAGASAAGAGLVKLILDDSLYPALASAFGGVMAVPASVYSSGAAYSAEPSNQKSAGRSSPNALLLGPGWGRGEERLAMLRLAMEAETSGIPLILDADAIALLKILYPAVLTDDNVSIFHGRAILTPHAGELEAFSGIPKEQLLSEPALIASLAQKLNAVILFKSHVMIVAAPDGRLGFIDGMEPSLGTGGSGDLLAGLCVGIAARLNAAEKQGAFFDPYTAAVAAGTLLVAAAGGIGRRFYDPLELAEYAAVLAGEAWLPETKKMDYKDG